MFHINMLRKLYVFQLYIPSIYSYVQSPCTVITTHTINIHLMLVLLVFFISIGYLLRESMISDIDTHRNRFSAIRKTLHIKGGEFQISERRTKHKFPSIHE